MNVFTFHVFLYMFTSMRNDFFRFSHCLAAFLVARALGDFLGLPTFLGTDGVELEEATGELAEAVMEAAHLFMLALGDCCEAGGHGHTMS